MTTKPITLREEIEKILDKYFPDEMDSTMYHPNLSPAVDAILSRFQKVVDKAVGDELKGYTNDLYCSGSNSRAKAIKSRLKRIIEGKIKI